MSGEVCCEEMEAKVSKIDLLQNFVSWRREMMDNTLNRVKNDAGCEFWGQNTLSRL